MIPKLKRNFIQGLTVFVLLIVIVLFGFYQSRPPKVVPGDAAPGEFSAMRAINHLKYIAAKPHALGTAEHLKVLNYIFSELKRMGTEPELQVAEVFYPDLFRAATVKNIIVKLHGTQAGKSVLVVGHYDSVEDSYGASDDGSAVVTMLETIRLLLTKPPFKNDIIFLFTDGEEAGLLGAKAFIDQHPLAKNIGIVLNFEASGTSGQSLMFETSSDNNWIISEFAKAVPYPVANSVSYEIYRNMPNDTDLSPFKKMENKGLNFAFIDNRFDYHTGGDNMKNTSLESIQHHGSYAAALTQHFGNADLDNSEKGNAVYFNTIGTAFVHYSYKWIAPFIILTCLFLVLILIFALIKRNVKPLRILFGFFAFIIHLVLAPSIVTLVYFFLVKYYPGEDARLLFYNQKLLLLGFVSISVAVSITYYKLLMSGIKTWHLLLFLIVMLSLLIWSGQVSIITVLGTVAVSVIIWFLFRKPSNVWELSFGSFIGWAIIMVVASIMMPGVSYLFTWPLLFSLIPVGIAFSKRKPGEYSYLQIGLLLVFSLPVLLWFSNLTLMFLIAMGLKMAGAAVLFTVLCLSLLIMHIEIITRVRPWLVPVISFSVGLFFILYGSINLDYNHRYKKQDSLIYATNGNTNETFWTMFDAHSDEWTVQFLTEHPDTSKLNDFFAYSTRDFIKKNVKMEPLPIPDITVLQDSIFNGSRFLKLHINSGRNANCLNIQMKSTSDSIKASINDSQMKTLTHFKRSDWYLIRYFTFPPDGIDMELKFAAGKHIEIRLTDFIFGLPEPFDFKIRQRPDYMMSNGDRTMSAKSFVYE